MGGGFTRLSVLVVDFDELNFRELLEVLDERLGNGVECAVRLAVAAEVDIRNTIGVGQFAIAGKAVQYKRQSLVAFDIAGTLEEFIQHRADKVSGG